MSKKLFLLSIVLLFTFNSFVNASDQTELLKNLSLFYVGAGLGLRIAGNVLHKLSGAPEHKTEGKVFKRKIYFQEYNTDSVIKKNLSRVADSFLVASEGMTIPLQLAAWTTFWSIYVVVDLVHRSFHDMKNLFLEKDEFFEAQETITADEEEFL